MMTEDQDVIAILNEYHYIVKSIVRLTCHSSAAIDVHDLYQIGDLAILEAVKSYDPSCGTTIKSFVGTVVRNAIFHEAGRFLGVFTVDHRVTSLAAKVNRLHQKGHTDEEIIDIINKPSVNSVDSVRNLRISYDRRQHVNIDDNIPEEYTSEESTIQEILQGAVQNDTEQFILDNRILGDLSVKQLSRRLNIAEQKLYRIEHKLKERIKQAIIE